ncbi:gamma-tubulin complex component 6 [Monodelphis domestica]|uniref:Gamma-tubulin complex component 6 n=1 Tax=Monodelphis domestica TaxID=13616 RepID=F7FUQ9_MONDO|nr:gamma-tubulin complex component 6 [Monodelphis domestica]
MASITQLFNELCEVHLGHVPWKTHPGRPGASMQRAKQGLKKVVYDALFMGLFQEEGHKLLSAESQLPVKNKILMLSFNLRVGGLGPDADRLEELVDGLEAAPALGLPLTEIRAVLDLLVRLAGSGPPVFLPQKRDYFLNNKHVGRNVKHQGYDYYDVSMFEADTRFLIASQEQQCWETVQKTLQVMEAPPGTGLRSIGLFAHNYPGVDRFERETHGSLFGALVHSHTYDMDIKLDLPPVPDSADLSGLAIQVPQSIDQSEDEGFQSASNLTPDSQSEPSMTPDIDLWDAVLTYEPSKRRCWERIGCPPGNKEEPYLTEAGREAFDMFYRLREGELQLLHSGLFQLPSLFLMKERDLVKDVLNVLIGVVSATFSLSQATQVFEVKPGVYVSGTSPQNMSSLLSEVAEYGSHYTRLSHFSLQPVLDSSYNKGLVFQAFTSGLRKYLQYYRACVLSTPPTLSLLTISFLFKKLGRQLRYLAELCGVGTAVPGLSEGGTRSSFPTGVKLLSYLYQEALDNCSNEHYPVLLSLLKASCEPYTRFIHDWVYSGVFRDVYGEFMIQVNEEYLRCRDKFYWTHGYVLISKDVEDCVPGFLKHVANDVYVCGKTINLLKLCCPQHYICWSDIPVPRISVIFSLDELKEIEKDCAVYVGRMERLARHSAVSKEEKKLRMEIAKQELIVQARDTASRGLKSLNDRHMSERMVLDAKKREQFQKLKDQFLKDQERRLAAKQEEIDDDFSYARELRAREKRLKALEEELERRARQDLIDHYSKLSEEAARREQRALWKIQRHKLETARLNFLLEDQKHIQEMLQNISEGKCREKLDILPSVHPPGQAGASRGDHRAQAGQCSENRSEAGDSEGSPESVQDPLPAGGAWSSGGMEPQTESLEGHALGTRREEPVQEVGVSMLPGSSLDLKDFLPRPLPEEPSASPGAPALLEAALQTISMDLPPGGSEGQEGSEEQQQQLYDFTTVLRPSATAETPSPSRGLPAPRDVPRPRWSFRSHGPESSVQSGLPPRDLIPEPEAPQPCPGPASGRPRWNIHGHKDATTVEPAPPRGSVHGHVSESSIPLGACTSEVVPSRPRWNLHGHASLSHMRMGDLAVEAETPRPRCSPFGHASWSSLQLGPSEPPPPPKPPSRHTTPAAAASTMQWFLYNRELGCSGPDRPPQGDEPSLSSADKPAALAPEGPEPILKEMDAPGAAEGPEPILKEMDAPGAAAGPESILKEMDAPGAAAGPESILKEVDVPGAAAGPEPILKEVDAPGVAEGPEPILKEMDTPGDEPAVGPVVTSDESEDLSPNQPLGSPVEAETPAAPPTASPGLAEPKDGATTCTREQAYLKALSDQYCLEKYQDSYELMSEPPVSHLLRHIIPRPFSFPLDPPDETSVQLSELLTLPVLMKHSITAPLVSHVSLVNKAVVDYYFVELHLEKHFEALRHFLLMEDGEFAQSLSDLLFEKLGSGQTPGELLNPLVLNSFLTKALQYSLHGDTKLAANLSFALKYLPDAFTSNAPDALSCLELRYKVDWPLNIVITESCLNKYNKIFSFLLQLKHMMWTLKDICFHLKRTALVNHASGSVQFRQLQLFKHEMQHFVKVIQGYIANQILHVTWREFGDKLSAVSNLEEIHRTHAEYLNKAIFRGLLTEKAAPVMNIIHSVFSLILKFRVQLISQAWAYDGSRQVAVHPNFALMQQSYSTFKYYSHFLFKVVTKLVNRGYQPHLEDFLLRINFNNYYRDS